MITIIIIIIKIKDYCVYCTTVLLRFIELLARCYINVSYCTVAIYSVVARKKKQIHFLFFKTTMGELKLFSILTNHLGGNSEYKFTAQFLWINVTNHSPATELLRLVRVCFLKNIKTIIFYRRSSTQISNEASEVLC